MNNYITQGTTITVQTSVLKETINNKGLIYDGCIDSKI